MDKGKEGRMGLEADRKEVRGNEGGKEEGREKHVAGEGEEGMRNGRNKNHNTK